MSAACSRWPSMAALILIAAQSSLACKSRKPEAEATTSSAPARAATPSAAAPSRSPAPTSATSPAAAEMEQRRIEFLRAKRFDEASRLCDEWIARADAASKAEGHKCAAHVSASQQPDSGRKMTIADTAQRLAVGGMAPKPRYALGDMVTAIGHLDQAAEFAPGDLSIHEGRLFLRMASGDYPGAATTLAKTLDAIPNSPAAGWLTYLTSFPRDEAAHAVAFAEVLVARYPSDAAAHARLGEWLGVAGRTSDGISSLRRALELAPDDAMSHWRLGELLEKDGKRDLAAEEYRESLALGGELLADRQATYQQFVAGDGAKAKATTKATPASSVQVSQ